MEYRTLLGKSSKTLIWSKGLECVGFHSGVQKDFWTVQRPQHISINLRVWNSVPGLRTFLRLSSKTPIHFNVPEGVGFYPRVQIIFGTESRDPNAFHGVELCPKSWDIFGTKFRDPDPFQCPRRCGVPSRGPDHLWERVPRPQCVSFNLRV